MAETRRRSLFFKVLNDHATRLRLPPLFVQEHREHLSETAKLTTSAGRTWVVQIQEEISIDCEEERASYLCFMGLGWKEFAKDLKLKDDEILVFDYRGGSVFDVSVFGSNECERNVSSLTKTADPDFMNMINSSERKTPATRGVEKRPKVESSEVVALENAVYETEESSSRGRRTWVDPPNIDESLFKGSPFYFEVVLRPYQLHRMTFPSRFCTAAGLKGTGSVEVEYTPTHHRECLKLIHKFKRIDITRGWIDFGRSVGLAAGQKYSFEFKPDDGGVIHVKEVVQRT